MRHPVRFLIYLMFFLLVSGCEEYSPGNLSISNIDFTETYSNKVLDLPNGGIWLDNPDFDMNNPDTWTGNMEKYVNHNYIYSVSYSIKNSGGDYAYDAEIDLYYTYSNGDEEVETKYLGNIRPNGGVTRSITMGCTNKQLVEVSCEVFWFN